MKYILFKQKQNHNNIDFPADASLVSHIHVDKKRDVNLCSNCIAKIAVFRNH